ncbi:hypothetical protein THRCLA_06709 [Thraustotheca clavata]|uniref:Uncharacterized protein n=1 Tax=Thraustotheca clavata TaxID=74557 RepID=A0A1V9ZKM0_9STRA|nr:hypothetical protein THRCLA_06709 [Thraustotheca clavata]
MNASKDIWSTSVMDLAAMNGHLNIVKWISNIENGPGCTVAAMDGAAKYGHLDVVQFINIHRTEGCTSKALKCAINNGYPKVVEYLLLHQPEQNINEHFFSDTYFGIEHHRCEADRNYLGVLQCLKKYSFPYINEFFVYTTIHADPSTNLKYLYENKMYGMTKKVFETIIETGDKNAIRYALEIILTENNKRISLLSDNVNTQQWTPVDNQYTARSCFGGKSWKDCDAMVVAAQHGDLDTIKLLHQSRIHCNNTRAMDQAAAIGRLDILNWLHTHRKEGCTNQAMTFAAARGHLDVVKWLHEVRGLNCTNDGLSSAAYNGDVAMVSYLISIPMDYDKYGGCCGDSCHSPDIWVYGSNAVDRAASNGHIDVVKLLHDYPATTNAMDKAVRNGHFDMIKFLDTNRIEGCTIDAFTDAIYENRLDILKYLIEHECSYDTIHYENLCIQAANCNNIEMLKYCMNLLENEIASESKEYMMYMAAESDSLEIFQWLHETKHFELTSSIRETAQRRSCKKILKYLAVMGRPRL